MAETPAKKITPEEYIKKYKSIAVRHITDYGIPASITLAQGMLESAYGNSKLAREAKNHFGIKCHKDWTGATYTMDDDAKDECFRKYKNPEQSYEDHAKFLKKYKRYAFLFEYKVTDYKKWARGLKKAGYATNPKYAEKLIDIIERYKLYEYDTKSKKKRFSLFKKKEANDTIEETITIGISNRQVFKNNGVDFIIVTEGDNLGIIGDELDTRPWLLRKYNDMPDTMNVQVGDTIYIKPKRRRAQVEKHIVAEGETLFTISQRYGISIKAIIKKNRLLSNETPAVGTELWLQRRKPKV